MIDPTVELSAKDERDWRAERQEEIAAICWQKCKGCNGIGFTTEHWPADDDGPDYVLHPTCLGCTDEGQIQLHDPLRVSALFDAADDARERMGVGLYTRITSALSLAIEGAVNISLPTTVASVLVPDKFYTVSYIAIWLVKAAEKKMAEDVAFIQEERAYD